MSYSTKRDKLEKEGMTTSDAQGVLDAKRPLKNYQAIAKSKAVRDRVQRHRDAGGDEKYVNVKAKAKARHEAYDKENK